MELRINVYELGGKVEDSDDPVKQDKELHCDKCGQLLCDIEDGDSLMALVLTMLDHKCRRE